MAHGAGPRIINIGSAAGRITAPLQSVYTASKHALEGLNDCLRQEVAPQGIQVRACVGAWAVVPTRASKHALEGLNDCRRQEVAPQGIQVRACVGAWAVVPTRASKHALEGLNDCLRQEVAPQGVHVRA